MNRAKSALRDSILRANTHIKRRQGVALEFTSWTQERSASKSIRKYSLPRGHKDQETSWWEKRATERLPRGI